MTPAKIATLSLPPSLLDRSFSLSLLESLSLGALALGVTEVVLVRPSLEDRPFTSSLTLSLDLSNLFLRSLLGSLALSSTLGASGLGFTSLVLPPRPSLEEAPFRSSLILSLDFSALFLRSALGSLPSSFLDWSPLLSAGLVAEAGAEAEVEVAAASSAKAWGAEMAVAVAVATASAIAIARLRIISP